MEDQELLLSMQHTADDTSVYVIESDLQFVVDNYYAFKYNLSDGSSLTRQKRARSLEEETDGSMTSDNIVVLTDYQGPDENDFVYNVNIATNCDGSTGTTTESMGKLTYDIDDTRSDIKIQSIEIYGATLVDKIAPKWINSSTEITENSTDDEVATAKSVFNLFKNSESGGISDWDQTDSNGEGYIKNKPFYEEEKTITFLNPLRGYKKNVSELNLDIISGKTYDIIFNYTDGTSETVQVTAVPEEVEVKEIDKNTTEYILKYSGMPLDTDYNMSLRYYLEDSGEENKCICLVAQTDRAVFYICNNLNYIVKDDDSRIFPDGNDYDIEYPILDFGKVTYVLCGDVVSVEFIGTSIQTLSTKFQTHLDWNENNPNKAGFIENRPFYSEIVKEEPYEISTKYDSSETGINLTFTKLNDDFYMSELTSINKIVQYYAEDIRLILEIPTGLDSDGNVIYSTLTREFTSAGYYSTADGIGLNGGSIGDFWSYGGDISLKYDNLPSSENDYLYYQDKDNDCAVQIYLKLYAVCDNGKFIEDCESYLTQYGVPMKVLRLRCNDGREYIKQLDTKYIPDYVSKTEVLELIDQSIQEALYIEESDTV